MYATEGDTQVVDLKGIPEVVNLEIVFDGEGHVSSGAINNINFSIEKATPPPVPTEPYGCTLTEGYWKTHASGKKYHER